MAKTNIWMPFYIGDYMAATTGLSTEQHGAYLLLLFAYWDKQGPLPDNDAAFAQITRLSRRVWTKQRSSVERYFQVADGMWHHRRVDEELAKARVKSEKATTGALKRWGNKAPVLEALKETLRTQCDGNANALRSHGPGICLADASHSHSHSQIPKHEREQQSCSHVVERPSLREVHDEAQRVGLAPWKAEDWFHEMEGCGWLDFNHRPIGRWQSVLTRVRTKWEADGRPMQPTSSPQRHSTHGHTLTPLDLKTIIAAKEIEANTIKQKHASETAMGMTWAEPEKRVEWVKIRKEIKELNNRLSKMA